MMVNKLTKSSLPTAPFFLEDTKKLSPQFQITQKINEQIPVIGRSQNARSITQSQVRPKNVNHIELETSTPKASKKVSTDAVLKRKIEKNAERKSLQEVRIELAKKLNDIERVDKIIYEYSTIVKDTIPDATNRKLFEQWMVGISYFLGSQHYNHELFFKHQAQNDFFTKNKEFKTAFRKFSRAIQRHSSPLHKTIDTARKVKNIAIMYPGSGGGGHKSPATAMGKYLESQGYNVKLLDIDQFESGYDPKIGGLTRGEIFSKIYQQEGNTDKAYQMWNEGNDKQPIKDRKFMKDLTDTLRDFNTDHLFVVAHHQPEHSSLAYQLGVPTTYVHTDNEFHHNLQELCLNQQEIKTPLVNFTALSNQSDFYHYLLTREGSPHYNELPENVKKQMVEMNFPVRESFQPVTKTEKMSIREELGISADATVVKIAMGANGIPGDIKRIMKKIQDEEHLTHKPLHVLVVCGANVNLKNELVEEMANQPASGNVKFQILGFLNEQEMAKFDKASDVWVTKPGGSTSAEAQKMRKQMLYVPNYHHMWELTNAHRLEKENLAAKLEENGSLVEQINQRAAIGEEVEYAKPNGETWTQQLAKIVERVASPLLAVA